MPLIGGQNQPGVRMVDDQLCVNWMPQQDASGRLVLYPAPGYALLAAAGPGPVRSNGVRWKDDSYFVSGDKLIKRDLNNIITEVGTLATTSGYACIAAGHLSLAVVDGSKGYKWDGTTFSEITDPDLPECDFVEWLQRYFIYTKKGTGDFYISAIGDPATIDGLDFENAEARPDNLQRAIEHGGDLLLIGEYSSELWHNTGNPAFPWEPYIGAVYQWGTSSPHSAAKFRGWLYILAQTETGGYSIIKTAGGQVQKISTPAMDKVIAGYETETAYGCAYELNGRGYYKLVFPDDGVTYVYDDVDGQWHERSTKDVAIMPMGHAYHGGKHIFGDYKSHKLFELDTDLYTDDGKPITRIRRAPRIEADGREMVVHAVEVQMEPGAGLATGQGEEPVIWLKYTFDGYKWSHELHGTPGKIGEHDNRCVFRALGSGPMFACEIGASDPVNWTIVNAWADISIGR